MDIEISAQQLRQHSTNMKTAVGFMKEALETASNVMSSTSQSFESSAANAFRDQYSQLKSKFDLFYNEMTKYATFLDNTADAYERADQVIENAANDMLNS